MYSVSTVFGHRIHVLFMMYQYDVYWYCQMKKNEWLWKFWKKGGSREKRGGRGNEIHAPCACDIDSYYMYLWKKIQSHWMDETKKYAIVHS